MGIIKAFSGALGGTLADQWIDIITAGEFDEHTVVAPGVFKRTDNGRGTNLYGSSNVISNGSKIYVPENTIAFIFNNSGLEMALTSPGGYIYQNGQESIFNGDGVGRSIFGQLGNRFKHGGISADEKRVAFVNLREIRNIRFGTKGPLVYHDLFYDTDLEIFSFGSFTVKVIDGVKFIRNFVPPLVDEYSFDDEKARSQMLSEFLQSFMVAVSSLSEKYRVSQLPSQANEISEAIINDNKNAGSWLTRFGMTIVQIAIESIEFSDDSKDLVKQYSANKMNIKAYDDVSQRSSDIAAQQKIADGIKNNGLGDAAGMVFGMNMAQNLGPQAQQTQTTMSLDEQIETVKKLKELLDMGVLTQDEFDAKKKEVMKL